MPTRRPRWLCDPSLLPVLVMAIGCGGCGDGDAAAADAAADVARSDSVDAIERDVAADVGSDAMPDAYAAMADTTDGITVADAGDALVVQPLVPISTGKRFFYKAALPDVRGTVLFLDPDQPQLHRWSLTDKTFAPSVPLDMAPTAIASDRAGTTLFLAFVGGRIDTLTVADQARALFAMAPDTVEHLVVLDGHLLAFEVTDRTRALYDLTSRQRVFFSGHNRTSREAVYAPGLHRVFSHSYDAAAGVVEASDYDRAAPKLSAPVGPALPVQAKLGPPLRLFPGEDLLASANGDVLRTSDLTRSNPLPFPYRDLVFHGDRLYLVEKPAPTAPTGQGQLRVLDSRFRLLDTLPVQGSPERAFIQGDELVLLVRTADGMLGYISQRLP